MTPYYKVTTHDLRPPVQGGDPIWDGSTPYRLPPVSVDTGERDCAAGWNACRDLHAALRIAGLWPDGRPSRAWVLTDPDGAVERGDKVRAASWTVARECGAEEVDAAIGVLSQAFGEHAARMAASQIEWRRALGRPEHDPALVEQCLAVALERRGLPWLLRRFDSARDAWAARAAWAAWAARAAWDAWAARAARDAWAARAARDARDAWAARAALTVEYASLMGWISHQPDLLTAGLRDAYAAGLGVAVPGAEGVLGWAMDVQP